MNASMPLLARRVLLLGGAGAPFGIFERVNMRDAGALDLWRSFRTKFVNNEGRVIDNANGNVSHSEGQGWGLLFATAFNDRETFESIFRWTAANLRRPHDRLHAWRYAPAASPPVADLNNATDGDIFIASALARAAALWGHAEYAATAEAISRDILLRLVRRVGNRLVLLPGASGFERADGTVINLSYYAFPFLADLARITPSPQWQRLVNDGVALILEGRFGKWMLPPDWLLLDRANHPQPAPGWPPRFSFDAIRIPLWLVWSRRLTSELYQAFHGFWLSRAGLDVPAWTDLTSGEIASYPASAGFQAVMRLVEATASRATPDLPLILERTNYYDAALIVLSHLALRDVRDW
jgi:endoglucanase